MIIWKLVPLLSVSLSLFLFLFLSLEVDDVGHHVMSSAGNNLPIFGYKNDPVSMNKIIQERMNPVVAFVINERRRSRVIHSSYVTTQICRLFGFGLFGH